MAKISIHVFSLIKTIAIELKEVWIPMTYEPVHKKTYKMAYAPSEDSDQPGYQLSALRKLGSLATH